jgi:hypothetical protein
MGSDVRITCYMKMILHGERRENNMLQYHCDDVDLYKHMVNILEDSSNHTFLEGEEQ